MKKLLLSLILLCFATITQAQTWKTLFEEGQAKYELYKLDEAQALFEKAKIQAEKEFGKTHKNYVTSLDRLSVLYQEMAIQPEGYELERQVLYDTKSANSIKESLSIKKKMLGIEHESYAISLNNLIIILGRLEKYEEIEPLKIELVAINKKRLGENNFDYIESVYDLASLYYDLKKYDKALTFYEEAISLYKKNATDIASPKYAIYLTGLGNTHNMMGNYAKAEPLYEQALKIQRKQLSNDKQYLIADINRLAAVYYKQGKYNQAEPLLVEAVGISTEIYGENHYEYANTLFNLAVLYYEQDNYPKSEILHIEALNIRKKNDKNSVDYALSLNGLATLYYSQGLYEQAEPLFLESKNILKEENPTYPIIIRNLGSLYKKQGLYDKAEILMIDAKNIYEKTFGKQHPDYAISCNNLASLYETQNLYTKAENLYVEAKNIYEKLTGKKYLDYANICNNLASLYQKKQLYAKSEPLYIEAKIIIAQMVGKNNFLYLGACSNLADLYEKQNLYAKAEPLYIEGNQSLLAQIDRNFTNLSEKEKNAYYNTFSFNLEIFNSFVTKRYEENPAITTEAYNNTLATKALLFNAGNKIRERITNSKDENLKNLYQSWKNKKEFLAKVYALTNQEREKQKIDLKVLETEANEIEKQLSQKSELFATANDNIRYTWKDVQKKLQKDEVAIEMIRFRKYEKKWTDSVKYMVLIIKPESQCPEMLVLENGNELEGKYAKYYQNVMKNKANDKYAYLQYWSKISEKIKGAKKVYLSVDGIYNSLNVNTFINPATQKYVSEAIDIQLLTSTKDLVKQQKITQKIIKNGTLMGFPDYNNEIQKNNKKEEERGFETEISRNFAQIKNDTLKRFFDNENINELPGTKTEIEGLEKILQTQNISVKTFLGKTSTENNLKTLQSPQVLHIATHGFFLADVEDNQADDNKMLGMDSKKVVENPLLRSGLLFANAKSALKDGGEGVLTAYEAMNLNLDNTDLVVMSACETGLGEVKNGEGVYGLQRAFQTAGAKTILMSLWTVSDEATQALMTLFYENWISKKMSKRDAFKSAQNQLKQKYPEPYFWGAFVMVGE